MDFTSPLSSLRSILERANPMLPQPILDSAKQLQTYFSSPSSNSNSSSSSSPTSVLPHLTTLLTSDRWEPLGVALVLTIHLAKSGTTTAPYLAGPRALDSSNEPLPPPPVPVQFHSQSQSKSEAIIITPQFISSHLLPLTIIPNLTNPEPRIRTLIATLTGTLRSLESIESIESKESGNQSYSITSSVLPPLKAIIGDTVHLSRNAGATTLNGTVVSTGDETTSTSAPLDDTTGWKSLETSLNALACIVGGAPRSATKGGEFIYGDSELLSNATFAASDHVNRHVRASGIQLFGEMVKVELGLGAQIAHSAQHAKWDFDSKLTQATLKVLGKGLSDNWSQVRMAASVLIRTFIECSGLSIAPKASSRSSINIIQSLIPAMVFNRFYLADGVRLFSQEVSETRALHPPTSPFTKLTQTTPPRTGASSPPNQTPMASPSLALTSTSSFPFTPKWPFPTTTSFASLPVRLSGSWR